MIRILCANAVAMSLAASSIASAQVGACPLTKAFRQPDKRDNVLQQRQIWKSAAGDVLAFRVPLAVNTDGTAKSYAAIHKFLDLSRLPPRYNILCNGASITTAAGKFYGAETPGGCDAINAAIVQMGSKPTPWLRAAGDPLIDWLAIETVKKGGIESPCTVGNYHVSTTDKPSRPTPAAGGTWAACTQARYLDATTVPAIVIPRKSEFLTSYHVASGDLVVLYRPATGAVAEQAVFGIVGDIGPASKLGEATLAAHAELRGVPMLDPPTTAVARTIAGYAARGNIVTLVFPGTRPADGIHDNPARNADRAKSMFAQTLGAGMLDKALETLRSCASTL